MGDTIDLKNKETYENIGRLMEDIGTMLDRVFLTGILALERDVVEQARSLREQCDAYGLKTGAKELNAFAAQVEKKLHGTDDDIAELTETIFRLGLYQREYQTRLALERK